MKHPIIKFFCAIFCTLFIGVGLINTPSTFADDICNSGAADSVLKAAGCNDTTTELSDVIVKIIDGIIAVLGIVAVIYVIVGGVNYMTSNGDAQKVAKAKNTILYALIGLVICALAYAIVNFAIGIISGNQSTQNGQDDQNVQQNQQEVQQNAV